MSPDIPWAPVSKEAIQGPYSAKIMNHEQLSEQNIKFGSSEPPNSEYSQVVQKYEDSKA